MLNLCEARTFRLRECRRFILPEGISHATYSRINFICDCSRTCNYEYYCLLGCDTMLSGRNLSTFQGNLLSGSFKSSGMLGCVVGLVVFRVSGSGDQGTAILPNVEHYFPKDTRSHRRSLQFSAMPLPVSQISQQALFVVRVQEGESAKFILNFK